jgi:AcrR family transcriptional regulator
MTDPAQTPQPQPSGRAALLAAARAELAQVGVAGLSLRAVARRAGVSHAAPKHHFTHRAGLLSALAAQGFTALALGVDAAVAAPGPPIQRLAAAGHAYLRYARDEPELFDLMYRPELLSAGDPALLAAKQRAFQGLTQVVHEIRSDLRTDIDPDTVALLAWATVHGIAVLLRDQALEAIGATQDAAHSQILADALVDAFGLLTAQPTSTASQRAQCGKSADS